MYIIKKTAQHTTDENMIICVWPPPPGSSTCKEKYQMCCTVLFSLKAFIEYDAPSKQLQLQYEASEEMESSLIYFYCYQFYISTSSVINPTDNATKVYTCDLAKVQSKRQDQKIRAFAAMVNPPHAFLPPRLIGGCRVHHYVRAWCFTLAIHGRVRTRVSRFKVGGRQLPVPAAQAACFVPSSTTT